MNLGKLQRTLQRELTRNPAKTATLLALLPVAGYFILPLLWKQLPARGTTPPPAAASFVAAGVATAPTAMAAVPTSLDWKQLRSVIEQDTRMQPAELAGVRNPFQRLRTAEELAQEERGRASVATEPDRRVRPEDFGLQLTATIVGPAKRLATINGRLYAENAEIHWESSDPEAVTAIPGESFILKTITKKYVVLERQGRQFRLALVGEQ